jgi:MFS family permease
MQAASATTAKADQAKAAEPKKFDVGTVAALGVALGAIGTLLGGFVAGFLGLAWWQMPLAILGVLLAVSLPSVVIAWLKLRQRNLAPILDANGWAVNTRAKINVTFGGALTCVAKLPPGAQRDLADPFAKNKPPWKLGLFLLAVLILVFCWWQGKLDKYIPGKMRSTTVLGTNAPAYQPSPSGATNAPAVPDPAR